MINGKNVMDTLRERGYIKQTVFEEDLYKMLSEESVSFYVGFDPTADSLHVGHYLALMAMSHLQQAGHKPYVLVGGGTGKIGDPSGRSDMRTMMTNKIIDDNCNAFKEQMSKFFTFEGENAAVMVNNADWLDNLNYIEFIRDIGAHFSVNRMLTAECFKKRMATGLSFLEFNYMLMQAYDFLYLNKTYGLKLQCGGDDQWSNILAGADLIRRKEHTPAYAMTFQLLTTGDGIKMGKTQKGAVWLNRDKTSPYEFYQYWRNVGDADVEKCLKLLTFVPVDEIVELCKYQDERINKAKERLAFEVTKIVHTEEDAKQAEAKTLAAFITGDADSMPSIEIESGIFGVADILVSAKLAKSKGEAKRLIEGGGIKIGDLKIVSIAHELSEDELKGGIVLHKGKKIHVKISSK